MPEMDPRSYMPSWWVNHEVVKAMGVYMDAVMTIMLMLAIIVMGAASLKTSVLVRQSNDYLGKLFRGPGWPPKVRVPVPPVLMLVFAIVSPVLMMLMGVIALPMCPGGGQIQMFVVVWAAFAILFALWTFLLDRRVRAQVARGGSAAAPGQVSPPKP